MAVLMAVLIALLMAVLIALLMAVLMALLMAVPTEGGSRRRLPLGRSRLHPFPELGELRLDRLKLPIELKPETKIRDYQERSLSRMFSSHRARSGIIVLPCGAGKTLVGIVAATTIKRSCLVLCNSSVSVEQWYQQFRMWAQIAPDRISRFTSNMKEPLHKEACVLVSTYGMIGHTGNRAADTRELMEQVSDREWGLIILDEVHVAPADTFLHHTSAHETLAMYPFSCRSSQFAS